MRRQRVLNATSARSLCIFCACRISNEVPATRVTSITRIQQRGIATSNAARQSVASAPTPDNENGAPAFTFDPNSSLTLSEQKEKARRIVARRKLEAEQQQQARHTTNQGNTSQARARPEGGFRIVRHPSDGGQTSAGRQPRSSNGQAQARSVNDANPDARTSLGDAMLGNRPRPRQEATSKGPIRRDTRNRDGLNIKKVKMDFPEGSSVPPSAGQRVQAERRKASPTNVPQTPKVAKPGFLSRPSTSDALPKPIVGWGATQPDLRPARPLNAESPAADKNTDPSPSQQNDTQPIGIQQSEALAQANLERPAPPALNLGSFGYYEDTVNEAAEVSPPSRSRQSDMAQPLPVSDLPPASSGAKATPVPAAQGRRNEPEQEISEMEAWRRRIQEFDRMNAAASEGAIGSSKQVNRPSNVQNVSRRTSDLEQQSSRRNSHNDRAIWTENRYRASRFDARALESPAAASNSDESSNWQHLRRRESEPSKSTSSQHEQGQAAPEASIDDLWVDKAFQAHQKARSRSVAPQSAANDSAKPFFQMFKSEQSRESRVCIRCGEKGHIARNCTLPRNPPQREDSSSRRDANDDAARSYGSPNRAERRGETSFSRDSDVSGRDIERSGRPEFDSRQDSASNRFDAASDRTPRRNLVRRVDENGTVDSTQPVVQDRRSQIAEKETAESSTKRARFAESEASAIVEETKRGSKDARRRQWEDPEEDLDEAGKSYDRKSSKRVNRRERHDDDEDDLSDMRDEHRARKAARKKQKEAAKEQDKQAAKQKREARKLEQGTPIVLPEYISIQNLSQMLGVRYEQFVQRLERLGYDDIFPGKTLNAETSGMIAMEYNFDPTFDGAYREEEERDLKAKPEIVDKSSLPTRPPVVTIMGHVDHGKTTILDYLRKSSVAAGEAGGITQHIGAFSVPLSSSGKTITFLDTPGHAAFLAMRQRGANVTDIVILVVAADDSVKPQTLEAIKHARDARVPMIVALNKVDKPEADIERCKQDLARHGVDIEDYGGETQVVCVSGKTGRGMDELEENVVTLSEILDHRAETDGDVEGWVLEATTKLSGRVATVLVRRGTLRPGNIIVAGKTWARVRSLRNEAGVAVNEVGPGMPVEVDGWRDQPAAGDEVLEAPSEQKATSVVDFRVEKADREKTAQDMEAINEARRLEQEKREKEKAAEAAAKRAAAGADTDEPAVDKAASKPARSEQEPQGQMETPFIIKADVSGSVEAVAAYILSVSNPLIAPTILSTGVGAVHESDIELAYAAGGHIIAFNLPADQDIIGAAKTKGVKILENNIIYRVLDDVKAVLEEKLPPIVTQRVLGEADISAAFEISVGGRKKVKIAGCKVRNGVVSKGSKVRILRAGEKVYDGVLDSLKSVKKDVTEMRKGTECGMGFDGWETFEIGDSVQCYEEISEKRRL